MSCHHCTECIAAAFMNDPYDWDGEKEPIVYVGEADSDAALTMQILKQLTHDPVLFMDVRHWDEENQVLEFCNCGSEATWYAVRSNNPKENLSKVTLFPCLDIYAGGGCYVNCQAARACAQLHAFAVPWVPTVSDDTAWSCLRLSWCPCRRSERS